jgi:hypothetical protein
VTKEDGKISAYASLKSSAGIVIPEVRKVLLNKEKNPHNHRTNVIFPSEMARAEWCPRATYYRMTGCPEPASNPSFTLSNVFAEGNRIHSKWQGWMADTGLLWGDWKCSRCAEYVKDSIYPEGSKYGSCVGTDYIELQDDITRYYRSYPHDWDYKEVTLKSSSLPVSGHADGAFIKHDCLIEIKSVGLGTIKFDAPKIYADNTHDLSGKKIVDIDGVWSSIHRPLLAHMKQGQIYMWMAGEMGMPFDKIVFLYEFKPNQKAKEFTIFPLPDILDPLLETAKMITDCVSEGKIPACTKTGGCSECRPWEKAADTLSSAEDLTWD